jgi:hypothetical protein
LTGASEVALTGVTLPDGAAVPLSDAHPVSVAASRPVVVAIRIDVVRILLHCPGGRHVTPDATLKR